MKKKYIFIGILLILFISCSTVHAESNDTDIYQNAPQIQNFQILSEEIQNTPENGVLVLQNNYTLNENTQGEENVFKEGINLNKNITIEGNNHVIDAKNLVRIFNVNSNVTIRNLILVNGYHTGGYNGAGAINVNTGALYLENSILLNNDAFSTTATKGTALSDGGGAICTSSNTYTSISNCTFINNTIRASCNVGGGAIMFKAGSSFTVKDSFFINNRVMSGGSTYGGAIAERGMIQGEIANSSFVNNSAGIGRSISINKAPITGNEFFNSGVDYDFGSSGSCTYNTFINGGVSYSNIAACSAVVKNNWYGYNPSSKNSDVISDLINNNGTIYVSLTKDGYGNNLSNPEYLYPRNVEFSDNVKYRNLMTQDAIAINEITETLEEGYIYHVNVRVDRQILDLYFKYVEANDFNSTVPRYSENYSDYIFNGEFRIKGKNKVYNSFYEAVNDALSMDGNITIYIGEGTYTKKWSDTYYNYDYMNYDFNIASNDKVITIIGAGNDKTIFKGETFGFKINGNSTFRFVNITFEDFKDSIFLFNTTDTSIYFTNCEFKSISTKYAIYLTGENTTMYIDGCYVYGVSTYPFWNNADTSYIVIDSSIFDRVNYNYAISEIHTENDFTKHIKTIYHNFNDYYIFNHNFLLNKVEEGFDCTPKAYLSDSSIGLGDSVDIIADFNYFTNSTGTYRFDSNFIDDFTVTFSTPEGTKSVNLKNSVACLKYSPTEAGTQTITVTYGDKSTELTLNIADRQMPSFSVEGRENIVATLPEDAEGQITFNVNGAETIKDVNNGIANLDLTPLEDIKYVVEVSYSGDSKYMPASETLIFSPMRNITYLEIKCNETTIYSDAVIEVHTNVNGNIKLIIDKTEYTNITENNVATFVIKDLIRGLHNITAIFEGDSNYLPEKNTSTISIIKNTPTLTSYVKTVLSGEDVIMNITLNDDISSDVYIFMNGKVYRTSVVKGTGYLNFTRLHGGDYTYRLYYNGNDKYYPAENNKGFTVIKLKEIHVDAISGNDENMGTSPDDAMKTIKCALECIRYNGTIYLDKGTFSGADNTRLTITKPVTITGIDDAVIDGELKNYFFKVNGGLNFTLKNVNFKNVCSNAVENPEGSILTIEDSTFDGGPGSAVKNYGNLYIDNSTFTSLSSSTRGVAVSNYGKAAIANSTFKNSLARGIGSPYDGSTIYGVVYNEGEMTIQRCVFDNNTPKNKDDARGSYNIYNYGNLKANHNIFINSNYEKYVINENKPLSTYIFNSDKANVTLNYYDANRHIERYINFDIGKYFVLDLEQDYYPLNIGDKANVTATLKLDNGTFYKDYDLLPDIYISFNVNGKTIVKKLVDGKASVEFNESDAKGSYNVTATLGDCTKLAEIDVGKVNSSMEVEYEEIYYSEVAQFHMTVTGNYTHQPSGSITLRLNDDIYTAKIKDTKATIKVPDLTPGTYDLEIRYEGDADYNKAIFHANYTVDKRSPMMSLSIAEVYYGQNGLIIVSMSPSEYSNQAYMYITDENNQTTRKTVYVRDGTELKLKNFAAGEYNITITTWENRYYKSANATAIFKVNKYSTNLSINATDINAGETEILNITLTPKGEVAGEANLTINNYTQTIFLKNGENKVTLKNLTGGTYNVTVTFSGDKKYAASTATTTFTAKMFETNITAKIENNILYINTTPNSTGKVFIYINDDIYEVNLTNSQIIFPINFKKAENYIFIYYPGDGYYNYTMTSLTYECEELLNLTVYDSIFYNTENATVYVTLTDEEGYGIADRTITITLNNETYIRLTGNDGSITLEPDLAVGTYEVTAQYRNRRAANTITILEDAFITGNDTQAYTNVDFTYQILLKDHNGKAIANAEVSFEINGKTYKNQTDNNGLAAITLKLKEGNYNITTQYKTVKNVNNIYVGDILLKGNDLTIYNTETGTYQLSLTDKSGKGVANQTITITLNSKKYTRTTDENGQTSLSIKLDTGNYTITATYNNQTIKNTITVLEDAFLSVNNTKAYENTDFTHIAKLTDHNGKAIPDAEITFIFENKTYTNKTNSEGLAVLTLNLKEGNYTITSTYKNITKRSKIIIVEDSHLVGNDVKAYSGTDFIYNVKLTDHTGNGIADAEITFKLEDRTFSKKTDSNGQIALTFNLETGNYTITATYKKHTIENNFEIIEDYILSGNDVKAYSGTDFTYNVKLTDHNAKAIKNAEITFTVNGKTYTNKTDVNGKAIINLNLKTGTYKITARYRNTTTTNTLTIIEDYILRGNDIKSYADDNFQYKVNLTDHNAKAIKNTEITFTVNGKTYTNKTDVNGHAAITLNLKEGNYTITATYKNTTTSNELEIIENCILKGQNIKEFENTDFTYTITLKRTDGTPLTNRTITFIINNKRYTNVTNEEGKASRTLNLPANNYTITAIYKNTRIINNLTIIEDYILQANNVKAYSQRDFQFKANLTDHNGNPVKNAEITFTIENETFTNTTDNNGQAILNLNLEKGNYTIKTSYKNAEITNRFEIIEACSLKGIDVKSYENFDFEYIVTLTDHNNKTMPNQEITFTIENKTYTNKTDSNGQATITLNLKKGNYTITAKYADATTTNQLEIIEYDLERIMSSDVEMFYKDGTRFRIQLLNQTGPMANKTVQIIINNMPYTRTTDENGSASIALNLEAGTYNVGTKYNTLEKNNTVTIKSTIKGNDITKVFRNETQYYATFYNSKGEPLKNTKVKFNINGVMYERTTNENGQAKMNINLDAGTYIITATNPENGEQHSNTITVLSKIQENNDLTKYYRNESQYVVKIVKSDGTTAKAGQKVTFNINGVFYERTTNETGHVKMNINLNPGTYIITAEYEGCKASNTIKVLPTLTAKDLTKKYGETKAFEVKLVNGKGQAYANEKVTFNINGVFYERTTNEGGIAKLNINLQPGKYIITSTHNGLNIANTVTVQA